MDEQQQRDVPPAPIVSPDGEWLWDGQQWQRRLPAPSPTSLQPAVPWKRAFIGAGIALGLVAVLAGAFAYGRHQELARCETVPPEMVAFIVSGADFGGYALSNVHAVRSNDFTRVYFISGQITIPGQPSSIGTWASTRLDGSQPVWAIDLSARTSTHWGTGPSGAGVSLNDEGAQLSRDCVSP